MFYLLLAIMMIIPAIIFKINKSNFSKKAYLTYAFGVLTILAALRKYTIGIDLKGIYYPYFNLIKGIDTIYELGNIGIEQGFALFMKVITLISEDYQLFTIITSLISFPIFGYFIYKNSEDVGLSTILFLLTANYFMELNVVRQACAMSFIMIAYEMFKNKKNILFIIFILLATSFHISSIFFILIPFMKKIKLNNSFILLTIAATTFIMIFLPQMVEIFSNFLYAIGFNSNKNYASYLTNEMHGVSYIDLFSISEVLIALGIFLIGLYSYKLKNKSKISVNEENYRTLLIFSFLYFLFNFLALRITVIRRMALFCIPFAYALLPNAIGMMKNKTNKIILYFLFVLLIGARFTYMLLGLADSLFGVLPYEFFWK